ncbi:AAA family ATPase [Candidatus Uhrbacteria bacterium]|nr:AAA family ATPase [Candidatus Uhrbacteria bacterium]
MFLEKLEIQGFKSFAGKTALAFEPPKGKWRGMTAIVGPNGSGKSNVADSIRWVLGEQSLKLLRGKKGEDVIWHGSEKRPRAGFAEVSLYLNNEDKSADIEYSEVVITRRLYRDGESEYLINKNKVRLSDIQMLLAKANFGERHYAIIGQGMIDSILLMPPEERRSFFDEATGVKPFQIKKEQAINKLKSTEENLRQAEGLLAEIEPRMRSLSRAVKRLEEREKVEAELHELQHQYYGRQWSELKEETSREELVLQKLEIELKQKSDGLKNSREALAALEAAEGASESFIRLQKELQKLMDERGRLREAEFKIKTEIERAKQGKLLPTPLPLSKIISEINNIANGLDALFQNLEQAKDIEDMKKSLSELDSARKNMRALASRLEKPAPEADELSFKKFELGLKEAAGQIHSLEEKMNALRSELETVGKKESAKKSSFFEAQRTLQKQGDEVHAVESQVNAVKIELARLEVRREALEAEMAQELKERLERVKKESSAHPETASADLAARIQKLKYQLELIGGIDPETIAEHKETAERHGFLSKQTEDLRASLESLKTVIAELDALIDSQFSANFKQISDDFSRYFKTLFSGGVSKLSRVKLKLDAHSDEAETGEEEAGQKTPSAASVFEQAEYTIEISATPPGKRIKGMHMLSGGEKALTAIALIMAIISNQPSPFVVLDEVDAALDESNAIRFAGILDELGEKTQFIVVTHNRYTMEKAAAIYGVTMGEDGTSQLLSVKLEDIKK